jgi:protein phosphatase
VLQVACPHCKQPVSVSERGFGAPVACKSCGKSFTLTLNMLTAAPSTPAAPPPAVAPPLTAVKQRSTLHEQPTGPRLATLAWELGAATSTGKVRARNEDAYLVRELALASRGDSSVMTLLAVADGMGGHEAGEIASDMVIRAVAASVGSFLEESLHGAAFDPAPERLADALSAGMHQANQAIFRRGQSEAACRGMGATAAAALLWKNRAYISQVGDARIYHFHQGRLAQVTRDQTLVSRMMELGQLSAEEAARHPNRNEVLQAVGRRPELETARYLVELASGDWLLAASDGLHAHIRHEELEQFLRHPPLSAAQFARQLVQEADGRGGSDNTTVIVVRCL